MASKHQGLPGHAPGRTGEAEGERGMCWELGCSGAWSHVPFPDPCPKDPGPPKPPEPASRRPRANQRPCRLTRVLQ